MVELSYDLSVELIVLAAVVAILIIILIGVLIWMCRRKRAQALLAGQATAAGFTGGGTMADPTAHQEPSPPGAEYHERLLKNFQNEDFQQSSHLAEPGSPIGTTNTLDDSDVVKREKPTTSPRDHHFQTAEGAAKPKDQSAQALPPQQPRRPAQSIALRKPNPNTPRGGNTHMVSPRDRAALASSNTPRQRGGDAKGDVSRMTSQSQIPSSDGAPTTEAIFHNESSTSSLPLARAGRDDLSRVGSAPRDGGIIMPWLESLDHTVQHSASGTSSTMKSSPSAATAFDNTISTLQNVSTGTTNTKQSPPPAPSPTQQQQQQHRAVIILDSDDDEADQIFPMRQSPPVGPTQQLPNCSNAQSWNDVSEPHLVGHHQQHRPPSPPMATSPTNTGQGLTGRRTNFDSNNNDNDVDDDNANADRPYPLAPAAPVATLGTKPSTSDETSLQRPGTSSGGVQPLTNDDDEEEAAPRFSRNRLLTGGY